MNRTKIEYADYTLNIITGCTRLCRFNGSKDPNCYAYCMSQRLKGRFGYPSDDPFRPTFHSDKLLHPDRVRKPSRIFLNSMGETYELNNPFEWVNRTYHMAWRNPQHTFLVLTKNPDIAYKYHTPIHGSSSMPWIALPQNVWLGVSVSKKADLWRLDWLRRMNATVRFVSIEPLLEPILYPDLRGIHWVIIGALTGRRPFKPDPRWVMHLSDWATEMGAAVFLKDNLEWPWKVQNYPGGNAE